MLGHSIAPEEIEKNLKGNVSVVLDNEEKTSVKVLADFFKKACDLSSKAKDKNSVKITIIIGIKNVDLGLKVHQEK
jgi:hypothetical protein